MLSRRRAILALDPGTQPLVHQRRNELSKEQQATELLHSLERLLATNYRLGREAQTRLMQEDWVQRRGKNKHSERL
jgi:hypothetical protein